MPERSVISEAGAEGWSENVQFGGGIQESNKTF
jgi:hypothetical protein